ncbi:YcnI family copper-binding membrane protein [Actinomadura opuntiae]|uniref:YcnI family copper-binding membrane protein n=1 Tax=Actinomadura sp. OS1-43 TaxID=604315 RepID=UPI00255A8BD9|nr:YcnI family protein [Actinomadura sp. OS1-43]MDL4818360.1 YcnI family protein [Actinomadura sp. OS1-43]
MPSLSHARRLGAVASLAGLGVIALATAASAHVTVNPKTAEQGSYAKVSFRVPNEEDNADTTKLVVNFPADHPLASVSVRPLPGWTAKVVKSTLPKPVKTEGGELTKAVTQITWSGGKIEPGQFQEFDVSLGPLPTDTDTLTFKADQTYSNGETVKWEQDPGDGSTEPEHPAPTLKLTPKGTADATTAGLTAQSKPAAAKAEAGSDDGTARVLGGVGIGIGVIGLAVGGYGLARARSRA